MRELLAQRFAASSELPVYSVPDSDANRLTLITESTRATLDGSLDIALILCATLCHATRRRLRIVTRLEATDSARIQRLLKAHGVELLLDPQFLHLPEGVSRIGMNVFQDEWFVASGWRAMAGLIGAVPDESIFHLLLQDERLLYPHGDEYQRCSAVLARPAHRRIISTQLLYEHLCRSGPPQIAESGVWFEPAFPTAIYHPRRRPGKMRLLFCAEPSSLTDLWCLGFELIDLIVEQRTIDPEGWELLFVGDGLPAVEFHGIECVRLGALHDLQFAELIGTVDVGIYLSTSPQPGFPALALAASGAMVVTNERSADADLQRYAKNIIAARADLSHLSEAVSQAVALSTIDTTRSQNHEAAAIPRVWESALKPVLASVFETKS